MYARHRDAVWVGEGQLHGGLASLLPGSVTDGALHYRRSFRSLCVAAPVARVLLAPAAANQRAPYGLVAADETGYVERQGRARVAAPYALP